LSFSNKSILKKVCFNF